MVHMAPADYDAWYDTARGRWIGDTEYALTRRELSPAPGETLLDVGCGTGWFTRRFAAGGLIATGLDPNPDSLAFARAHSSPNTCWVDGDARYLPFPDESFDYVISIAALCFIGDERLAVTEIVRVARRRFVVAWLNRASALYWQKGRGGGSGAYHGAKWHTASEVRQFFHDQPIINLKLASAIFLPGGGWIARGLESLLPRRLPFGALLVLSGDKAGAASCEPRRSKRALLRC